MSSLGWFYYIEKYECMQRPETTSLTAPPNRADSSLFQYLTDKSALKKIRFFLTTVLSIRSPWYKQQISIRPIPESIHFTERGTARPTQWNLVPYPYTVNRDAEFNKTFFFNFMDNQSTPCHLFDWMQKMLFYFYPLCNGQIVKLPSPC